MSSCVDVYARRFNVKITAEQWGADFDGVHTDNAVNGFVMRLGDDNCDALVYLKARPIKCSEYGTLYHELHHATDHVVTCRSMRKERETAAYIYEHLAMATTRVLFDLPRTRRWDTGERIIEKHLR